MTRKSRRELERAVDDLGGDAPTTVREWIDCRLERDFLGPETEATHRVINVDGEVIEEPDHTGEVCIWEARTGNVSHWIAAGDLPDWINPQDDLPVVK